MEPRLVCAQTDCSVGEDGECLEGHSVEKCPHIRRGALDLPDPVDANDGDAEPRDSQTVATPVVPLFPGVELDAGGARSIMASSQARVIVVAGMPDVGKTTLLATLYEMFHAGSVDGYLFAGSRTQHAFERRCHKARTASRRESADTERTRPRDEVPYLHLALRHESLDNPTRHLLLTDISGETFRDNVRHSAAGTEALRVLQRADHFVLLLDAEQLAKPAGRQRAQADARMILRSCVEAGMIGLRTRVQVVFARWDRAGKKSVLPITEAYVGRLETDFRQRFGPVLADISFHRVAARPDAASRLDPGYGIAPLLRAWVEESELDRRPVRAQPAPAHDDREMIRFRWRVGLKSGREDL